jgi:DNA-binding response OmpR family regulator
VQRLRAKVEREPANPDLIKTVRGIGYRFSPPE